MSAARRWPLHPQPAPLEALSSWLNRLVQLYEMPVTDLLKHNLGLVDLAVPADLGVDPPLAMVTALAERTGVPLVRLRSMTLGGWVPWLFDMLPVPIQDARTVFDTYVRDNSVAQGEPVRLLVVGQVPVHRGERPTASRPGAWTRGRLLVSVGRDRACWLITSPGRARPRRGRRGIAAGRSCRARLATLSRRRRSPW
ncbi:hypothetical protein BN159_0291 [Streptomyces davaonensis JCM 4913]|uniref:TniQ domain-containing protein n=1 Tax=Streptomyces davaonensis (strain DSM 101723 / JCM 4913 / KCC S-0913 / 768) TaxID=1214101 RepID=K4QV22_STRDJ|nr:hypothetical protein BN159_0291 [Streptomyces davaonensis JCM 4913]